MEQDKTKNTEALEKGTYEIIRNRLLKQGNDLQSRLNGLNDKRKAVFGATESKLLATERISTENNCQPADMVAIGDKFIFGYNVRLGLKTETSVKDVFSVYEYTDHKFKLLDNGFFKDPQFLEDFKNLYTYYKNTVFIKFAVIGSHLYMVFQISKNANDIKAFKWFLKDSKLSYIDSRSDHEVQFPNQHEFTWKRTNRDQHVGGDHPHISIENKVFVEATEGDLTIKVEDNTESGEGIYAEPVENADQTLDDAEIYYSIIQNLIVLKIRPYQEKEFRYIVYSSKAREAVRVNSLEDSCVLLPDGHGLIFSDGYYLQTGEYKFFDSGLTNMLFEKRIASPNGEDYLYAFYNNAVGEYVLLSYNLIEQTVAVPIRCQGFSIFDHGEMVYFKADKEAKKHHAVQLWQTPYMHPDFQTPGKTDEYLFQIGNKDIVRAMAECHEVLTLLKKEESFDNLYIDLAKKAGDIIDSYYWLSETDAGELNVPLTEISKAANLAIDEFDKVRNIKKNTASEVKKHTENATEVMARFKRKKPNATNDFVQLLADLRTSKGDIVTLKTLRYVDLRIVEKYETELTETTTTVSEACVNFLGRDDALETYEGQVGTLSAEVDKVTKVLEATEIAEHIAKISGELDMLIEIVGNLKIKDATQTTQIIDSISNIYAKFNRVKAGLSRKRKELMVTEGKAEFSAQMRLVSQSVINYIDASETPEKCDENLSKLMVQLEELEGKFSEFDEFIDEISIKREEIYNAFESKKVQLIEARNKRAASLKQAADRIISAVGSRLGRFKTIPEINTYFASDIMLDKFRDIIAKLKALGDSVKADEAESALKTTREDAVRQLKDRQDLFSDGDNVIKLGNHKFNVNKQDLGLTMVRRDKSMYLHLAGTGFFEEITDPEFVKTKPFWNQDYMSENREVYRCEFLAAGIFFHKEKHDLAAKASEEELLDLVQKEMAVRYNQGYVKGVHDHDTFLILKQLMTISAQAGLLRYSPAERANARLFWYAFPRREAIEKADKLIKSIAILLSIFPETDEAEKLKMKLEALITEFNTNNSLFANVSVKQVAEYLFYERMEGDKFVKSKKALTLHNAFNQFVKQSRLEDKFKQSVTETPGNQAAVYDTYKSWIAAFSAQYKDDSYADVVLETAVALQFAELDDERSKNVELEQTVEGLEGEHALISEKKYELNYNRFIAKMRQFTEVTAPAFAEYEQIKRDLLHNAEYVMRLDEFKPRVLSSFVRNKLIDQVYLPLVGNNLAKQIGTAGENTRTDRMGMLLLISPPGYGKTTLMEYIANRLGLIFMKINGPAIGHDVVAVDPAQANNSAAREELNKLNLSFEMGDNVMIYLDDIQHCNPEFLQKFISLADGQRKIEGIYKGRSKTYDFRGKKVCVVMAGNPYTESGDKFQIPDMLSNRADIYNLGDIIGDTEAAFKLSYIENSLTSNSVLANLASKSQKDVYTFVNIAETGERNGNETEASYAAEEAAEYVSVLNKLLRIRDVIYMVNKQYIVSAAQSDDYRTEPPFKLQGSYRDMNKIAEKVVSVMNDREVEQLLISHYENESQTLTSDTEGNLLKYRELTETMNEQLLQRWEVIKETFVKNKGTNSGEQIKEVIAQMGNIAEGIKGLRE